MRLMTDLEVQRLLHWSGCCYTAEGRLDLRRRPDMVLLLYGFSHSLRNDGSAWEDWAAARERRG